MDAIPYVDELINEYLLFRGFVKAFTTFNTEKQTNTPATSGGTGTGTNGNIPSDVESLTELLLGHVRALELTELIEVWSTLRSKFFIHLDTSGTTPPGSFEPLIRSMEVSLKKAILVKAHARRRFDRVKECLEALQGEMIASSGSGASIPPGIVSEWSEWVALPYCADPTTHPVFAPFFHRKWFNTLQTSLKNFLTTLFKVLPLPRILAFNIERERRKKMTMELRSVKSELEKTKSELAAAQMQLSQMKSQGYRIFQRATTQPPPNTAGASASASSSIAAPPNASATPTLNENTPPPAQASWIESPVAGRSTSSSSIQQLTESFAASGLIDLDAAALGGAPFQVESTHVLLGHAGPVVKARFSTEGSFLATLSNVSTDIDVLPSTDSSTAGARSQTKLWPIDPFLESLRHRREQEEDEQLRKEEREGSLKLPAASTLTFPSNDTDDVSTRGKSIRSSNDNGREEDIAGSAFAVPYSASSDFGSLTPSSSWTHASPLFTLTFAQSDNYLLTGSASDGKVGVWSLPGSSGSTPKLRAEFHVGEGGATPFPVVLDLVSSPGDHFLISSSASKMHCECGSGSLTASAELPGVLEKFDLQTGKRSMVFQASSGAGTQECTSVQVNSIVLTHNANMLLSGDSAGVVRVWDTRQDTRLSSAMVGWSAHALSAVSCLRLCSDETTVVSAGLDGSLNEWSLHRMGKVVRELRMPTLPVAATGTSSYSSSTEFLARPEFTLDGRTKYALLSEGFGWSPAKDEVHDTHKAYLYSLDHPDPVQALQGHSGPVLSVDWHTAADLLATTSVDHTARIVAIKQQM